MGKSKKPLCINGYKKPVKHSKYFCGKKCATNFGEIFARSMGLVWDEKQENWVEKPRIESAQEKIDKE